MNLRTVMGAAALVGLAAAAAHAGEVANREGIQQQRVGQGVASGQLTRGEANHIQVREARINASRQRDLAIHGGHLSGAERARLNARENSVSGQIYDDKHNLRTQPGVVPR